VSFAVVPALPTTSDEGEARIASWIDSEALTALVAAFGGLPGDWAQRDLGSRLAWLDEFSDRWDFRRGAERNLAVDADFDGERAELIVAAAEALGLTGVAPPAMTSYDHVLILGGLMRACLARPLHAARLIREGKVVSRSVTALGGYRRLDGDELVHAKLVDDAPADEFEAMDAGVRHAFGVGVPVEERGEASKIEGVAWRVRTYRGADDLPINVIAAPSTEPGKRANTPDTYEWFAAQFAHLRPGERLLIITTAIYVPFQHASALRMFALPFGVEVDTVGMRPGDLDPRLSQEFRPQNYLQEVRSTIRALRDLHAALGRSDAAP
jgi:hypothetical protein